MNLELHHISKSYGSLEVLNDLSIDFLEARINCILGPSGCGKTTLLNIIAGLSRPDQGGLNGFTGKEISYIFQEDRLLPWKSVKENIRFILQSKYTGAELERIIQKNISLIELEKFSEYFPGQLSGGMKRRVSIARAFSYPSEIVLLDEPFKGIDISLKQNLMMSIQYLWESDRRTLIYVTHDIEEALSMGHRIFIFSGRPAEVIGRFEHPVPAGPGKIFSAQDNQLKENIRSLLIPLK